MTTDGALQSDAQRVAALALAEDGPCDITSDVSVVAGQQGAAAIEARESGIVAGCDYVDALVAACGLPPVAWRARNGEWIDAGIEIATISGALAPILRAERPVLNLLQRGCGIATLTRMYVDAVAGTPCVILHTRKTTPGLRQFEIAAVQAGGGARHRPDLAHALLIKDNHWQALRSNGRTLAEALTDAKARGITDLLVEVESLDQLDTACAAGATRLLIDNQTPVIVQAWAARARTMHPAIQIEATGGITLATVREYAVAGADFVSIGALTHSAPAADLALHIRDASDVTTATTAPRPPHR